MERYSSSNLDDPQRNAVAYASLPQSNQHANNFASSVGNGQISEGEEAVPRVPRVVLQDKKAVE
jgi:hypothetical protein